MYAIRSYYAPPPSTTTTRRGGRGFAAVALRGVARPRGAPPLGEPGGQTEILITEAYRWAFKRGEQYGIAAAYGMIIFALLLGYSWLMSYNFV